MGKSWFTGFINFFIGELTEAFSKNSNKGNYTLLTFQKFDDACRFNTPVPLYTPTQAHENNVHRVITATVHITT